MRTTVPSVRTIVFMCVVLFSTQTFSQSILFGGRNEIGLGIGPSFFLGDLGGNAGRDPDRAGAAPGGLKHLNVPLTKLAKGAFVAVYPKAWLGFRLGVNHTILEGDDAVIKPKENGDEQYRRRRDLNFKSSVLEGHLLAEIYPLAFSEDNESLAGFQPYVLAGIGAFKFNPKARVQTANGEEWVALQPLRTEGQGMTEYPTRKQYSLIGKAANIGGGFKYYFGGNKFIGMEVVYRSPKGANKDYIDDVSTTYIDNILFDKYLTPEQSALANKLYFRENEVTPNTRFPSVNEQRGDPKEGDSFFTSILRFGWVLPDPNSPGGRQARQMRCPNFY